jgi:hypothetical protein
MSLTAFVQQYVKPSRWWRRKRTLQITIWPQWLAQRLCPHIKKQGILWDVEKKIKTCMCLDCHRHLVEAIDCAHGEVTVSAWETVGNQLIARNFNCDHCGAPLEQQNLPQDARISHPNITNDSASRDH